MWNPNHLIKTYFKRCAALLACLFLVSACSLIGTLYQNATTLALYEIDSYFDLSAEQESLGTQRTDALLAWHKREALPLYVKQMRAVAAKADAGFNANEVNDLLIWGQGELRRVVDYATPQQIELLSSLSDKQLIYFQRKLAKDNAKYRKEWVDASREDALALRFDKLLTSVERIYGSFSSEQKARIRALSDARIFEPKTAYAERLARQAQFVALAKSVALATDMDAKKDGAKDGTKDGAKDSPNNTAKISAAGASTLMTQFTTSLETSSDYGAQSRKDLCTMLAAVSQIATPAQRLAAKNTLLSYANTFENISRGR